MRKCPPCNGTGKEWGIYPRPCQVCRGERFLADPVPGEVPCHWCNGNGRDKAIYPVVCSWCNGRGYRLPDLANELVKELGVREPTHDDGPCVLYLEAGKPRTAYLAIVPILEALAGDIRICDPYYGTGSLLRLDPISGKPIQFLTQTPDAKEQKTGTLPRALSEFVKEHPSVEFRANPTNDLHDRFIVCESELILLGHGLKDVGNKDSFIVRLNRDLAGDMIDQVIRSFDSKWATAKKLA